MKLGLADAFKSTANFSNISDETLYIGNAFHKAFICVNEKDTVAAAATAVVMLRSAPMMQPEIKEIIIDKPFFAVISRMDALPLFFSKITNPKK
ncbi:SERPIN domain-containing protein [Entamoeba marina]